VGIGYQERWRRFDEAVRVLRALLHGDPAGFEGEFYSTRGSGWSRGRRSGPAR
jgi:alkanesulfonate monooxygenase SsuD/methylene tetrahydromethanopterin reductase-like flavin-dependent oxidoreductase (luciferase family)